MAKQDYYSYCRKLEGFELSVQDLHDVWCYKCLNPECSRSINGTSKFENRVQNWEQEKFISPARLDPSDPRYVEIAAKRFLNVMPSTPGRNSSWDDPRDISTSSVSVPEALITLPSLPVIELPETPPPAPVVVAPTPPPPPPPAPVAQVVPEPVAVPEPVVVQPQEKQVVTPPKGQPRNTPNRSRQMVGGGDQKGASPVLDPWQPQEALKPGETLVKPGAKIKLGG